MQLLSMCRRTSPGLADNRTGAGQTAFGNRRVRMPLAFPGRVRYTLTQRPTGAGWPVHV